jgi:hypothetical protein
MLAGKIQSVAYLTINRALFRQLIMSLVGQMQIT